MDENDGDDGNNSSGNGPSVNEQIKAAVDAATKQLTQKNSELLNDLKKVKDKAKSFEGLDIEKLTKLQKAMDENEEAKLIADGQLDEVFARRYSRLTDDHNTRFNALEEKYKSAESERDNYKSLFQKERLSNKALRLAEKSEVLPEAMDTVVDKIMFKFEINEESGKEEARDEHGTLIMSKDGKNPLTIKEYLEETLKIEHAYCWPSSRGVGFSGGKGGSDLTFDDKAVAAAATSAIKTRNLNEFRRLRKKQREN